MSIVSKFNDIAARLGGTRGGNSITGAIDALNDVLAGSDQDRATTIEGAIRLLGEHVDKGDSRELSFYPSPSTTNAQLIQIRTLISSSPLYAGKRIWQIELYVPGWTKNVSSVSATITASGSTKPYDCTFTTATDSFHGNYPSITIVSPEEDDASIGLTFNNLSEQ